MNQVLARAETQPTVPPLSAVIASLADKNPQTRALVLAVRRMKEQPSHCYPSCTNLTREDLQTMSTANTLFAVLERECGKQEIRTHGTVASVAHALDLSLEDVQKLCAPYGDFESITSGLVAERLLEILDDEDG